MNPFTNFLRQWSTDNDFAAFVEMWDQLEGLVIAVYRGKLPVSASEQDFDRVWSWLRERYPNWQEVISPYWRATRVAGHPTQTDPFHMILAIDAPAAIPGDWRAMQHLPAAREAINRYLLDQDTEKN